MMVPNGFKDWAKPVGTGPFVLENFDPGVRIRLKKARPYWKDGNGLLDGVDVTVINDGSARLNALISGQMDAINRVDHKAVALLSKSPRIEVVRAPGGWFSVLAMEVDKAPFNNPDLRMAVMYARRPRADPQGPVQRLRHGRQRPSDSADRSLLQQGAGRSANTIRTRPPSISRRRASPIRRSSCRRRTPRFNGAVDQATLLQASASKAGHQNRREEGAGRRLLRQCLAEGAVRQQLLGRPAGGDADARRRLRDRARPGTKPTGTNPQFEKLLGDRAGGDRRGQAQAVHLGDASHCSMSDGGALMPVFRDWLDAHTPRRSAATRRMAAIDMDNGWIMEEAWLKS